MNAPRLSLSQEMDGTVEAVLDGMYRSFSGRDLALKMVSYVDEESLMRLYEFLSDITAEMVALSDSPDQLAEDLMRKAEDYRDEFLRVKQSCYWFRPSPMTREQS